MDYRRVFGLRKPLPIGDSTILEPQLENYLLFLSPYLEFSGKLDFIKVVQEDVTNQTGEGAKDKRKTRRAKKTTTDEKAEEESKKLSGGESKKSSEEASKSDDSFGIVLNVATVKPDQLEITYGEGNEIEVKVEQKVESEFGSLAFKRSCRYKYELPESIDKNSLVALRTSDDYLIILARHQVREDFLKESIEEKRKMDKTRDEEIASDAGQSKDMECSTGTSEEIEPKKPSISTPEAASDKGSVRDEEAMEVSPKADVVFFDDKRLMPVSISRMLRPPLDIFMLRKYMVDLESYASTARKYIENASFITRNSKTAERCLRYVAKTRADEYFEEANIKDGKRKSKILSSQHPDSGYTSTSHSDDSSRSGCSTTTKSTSTLTEMLKSPPRE